MTVDSVAAGRTSARRGLRSTLALIAILIVSAYIQFSVVSRTVVDAPFSADAREYFFSAYNLTHYGVYSRAVTWPASEHPQPPAPDAVRSPGYPLFLALLGAGDPEPTPAFLQRINYAQAALAVLSVWLLFLISSRFLPPGLSHAAALLAALSPHLAIMSTYVLSETLFTFLLFASILMSLISLRSGRPWHFLTAGILCGLCSLVRPTLEFLPVVLWAATWLMPRLRLHAKGATLLFAGFLLALAPSLLRNSIVPHDSRDPSLLANFILDGSYPGFMYDNDPRTYGYAYRFDPDADAAGRDPLHALRSAAGRFRQTPLAFVNWYLLGKPGFLLSWTNIDGVGDIFINSVSRSPYLEDRRFDAIRYGMYLLHWPLMLLGLVGVILVWWQPERWGLRPEPLVAAKLVTLVVLYAIVFHMIGAPYPRYGIPFRPLLYPLALLAIAAPWRRRSSLAGLKARTSPDADPPRAS